jgi:hypothetical protein
MSSMKFKRSCSSCNVTFFATDRRASFCPKCTRKNQEQRSQPPAAKPQLQNRTAPSFDGKQNIAPTRTIDARPVIKQKIQRPPKADQMTEELFTKVEAAYNSLKDSIDSLKKLHAQISHDLWVKPAVVAEAVKKLRQKPVSQNQCSLSDDDRKRVLIRYLEYVRSGERPVDGRRHVIAREMDISVQEVILAVREWSNQIMGSLNRKQLFTIEKEYWRILETGDHKFSEMPEIIAERIGFATPEQVARWLDQLHDDTKLRVNEQDLSEEIREKIINNYHEYLNQADPPEESLHWFLARKFSLAPNQIHRVLCSYRRSRCLL